MALDVVGPHGKSGRLIIRDTADDGTVILLACDELIPAAPAVVLKRDEAPDRSAPGFPWVKKTKSLANKRTLAVSPPPPDPFELTIDCSQFPSGLQRFRVTPFVAKALSVGISGKATKVELTLDNALDWGWTPADPEDMERALLA